MGGDTDSTVERFKTAIQKHDGDIEKQVQLAKSAPGASVSKVDFEVTTTGPLGAISKADDDFVIWGPASVEVVDKENDRIKAEALEDALPQLLKRSRLSYEHSDQIVGDILERYETDEPVTVKIAGREFTRTEFPTDVLKLDGMKPGLFVAGNIYDDTQKAQDVRKQVESGEIDSYSISGEAVVTQMSTKNGRNFTDILKLDLSAITLCREGMNQKAKFGVVSKYGDESATPASLTSQRAAKLAKSRINDTMSDNDNDDDSEVEKFVDALDDTLDDRLPDGEIATKSDVDEAVEEKLDEMNKESPDRPDGEGESGTETDEDYSGDADVNPAEESDKVEEKNAYSTEELKSLLPDDQYKAIAPHLERAEEPGPEVDEFDPMEGAPEEEVPPEEPIDEEPVPDEEPLGEDEVGEPDPVLASEKTMSHMAAMENEEDDDEDREKSGTLDWNRLTEDQKKALAKGNLQKADGGVRASSGAGGGSEPSHAGSSDEDQVIAKADNESVAADPAMRKVYDEDGNPTI